MELIKMCWCLSQQKRSVQTRGMGDTWLELCCMHATGPEGRLGQSGLMKSSVWNTRVEEARTKQQEGGRDHPV